MVPSSVERNRPGVRSSVDNCRTRVRDACITIGRALLELGKARVRKDHALLGQSEDRPQLHLGREAPASLAQWSTLGEAMVLRRRI